MITFQIPQHESKDKKMKFFSSGTVAMDVDIEKSGFFQGECPNRLLCFFFEYHENSYLFILSQEKE